MIGLKFCSMYDWKIIKNKLIFLSTNCFNANILFYRQFPTRERIEQKHAQKEEMDKRGERYSEPRKKFNNRFSNDNSMFGIFLPCIHVLLFFRFSNECVLLGKHNGSNKFDNLRRFPLNKRMQKSNVSETKSQDQSPANTESRSRRRREILVKNDEDDDDQYIRNLAPFRGTGKKLLILIAQNH